MYGCFLDENNKIYYADNNKHERPETFVRNPIMEDELFYKNFDRAPNNDIDDNLFICPITHDIMIDPVEVTDKNEYTIHYDFQSIKKWILNENTSPFTTEKIKEINFDAELRRRIHRKYPELKKLLELRIEMEMISTTKNYLPYLKYDESIIYGMKKYKIPLSEIQNQTLKICHCAILLDPENIKYVKHDREMLSILTDDYSYIKNADSKKSLSNLEYLLLASLMNIIDSSLE
jgi:hypothetical protein